MEILRRADDVSAFVKAQPESEIGSLIQGRMSELLPDGAAMEELMYFVILRNGDTLAELEAVLGIPVKTASGHQMWELIERHPTCYEAVFVLSSSGYGALVFVPDQGAPEELIELCRSNATPALSSPTP